MLVYNLSFFPDDPRQGQVFVALIGIFFSVLIQVISLLLGSFKQKKTLRLTLKSSIMSKRQELLEKLIQDLSEYCTLTSKIAKKWDSQAFSYKLINVSMPPETIKLVTHSMDEVSILKHKILFRLGSEKEMYEKLSCSVEKVYEILCDVI